MQEGGTMFVPTYPVANRCIRAIKTADIYFDEMYLSPVSRFFLRERERERASERDRSRLIAFRSNLF